MYSKSFWGYRVTTVIWLVLNMEITRLLLTLDLLPSFRLTLCHFFFEGNNPQIAIIFCFQDLITNQWHISWNADFMVVVWVWHHNINSKAKESLLDVSKINQEGMLFPFAKIQALPNGRHHTSWIAWMLVIQTRQTSSLWCQNLHTEA